MRTLRSVRSAARNELAHDWFTLSQLPEFQRVMEDLERDTIHRVPKKDKTGRVDLQALAMHMGKCELVISIRKAIEHGRKQLTP
jgi:hypothetical protein